MRHAFVLACLTFGCSAPDAPFADTGARRDAAIEDAGPVDLQSGDVGPDIRPTHDLGGEAQPDASDVGTAQGFGVITGTCGELDSELADPLPFLFENTIDFGDDPYDDSDLERLTEGGQEIIADGNAGGSSLLSEVFAYEVLARCEGAVLLKTETEVTYDDPMGKITDLLVEIDGTKIGVSVTRAVGFPREDPYTVPQAEALLTDKLTDIEASSANVSAADAWAKQILHIIAYAPGHADSIRTAYDGLAADVVDDTIVWVTVSEGMDDFLY